MTTIENERVLQEDAKVIVGFLLFRGLFRKGRHLHARARSQVIESFLKIKVLALHHKLENIATLVALTKAAPRPGLRPDHERRRMFVVMERAKARIVSARVAQFDPRLRDQV